jgi:VanZ family protein
MLAPFVAAQFLAALPAPPTLAAVETDPIPTDKVAHAAVSYSLAFTGALLLEKLDLERWQAVTIAGGATLLLGLAKEYLIDPEASSSDVLADVVGVGLGAGVVFTFQL